MTPRSSPFAISGRVSVPPGTLTAVDGSFDMAAGEVLGVVGESGAGKSLTGNAIIGLLEPPGRIAGGEICLKGERIDNLRPKRCAPSAASGIGMVFQDPLTSLNPLYTIADQLVETIRTHLRVRARGPPARHPAAGRCRHSGRQPPDRRLSAPVFRRHAPARGDCAGACAEPELVIADEPTTALDVSVQAQIIDLIKSMCPSAAPR
jgi:peptide/nickel transport system ATP-binding protein